MRSTTVVKSVIAAALVLWVVFPALAGGGEEAEGYDWPRWRGPEGNGTTEDSSWRPGRLGAKTRLIWEFDVGAGFSSPSIRGGKLYILGNTGGTDTVYCLSVDTGEIIWQYSYPCRAGAYAGPLSTPSVDGESVYTLSKEGHLYCFDASTGSIRWQKHLVEDFGAPTPEWGFASSVVVKDDSLLVNAFRAGIALRKDSGEPIWISEPEACGYASPVFLNTESGEQAVLFGAEALYGVDLATGEQNWSIPWVTGYDVNAADPLVIGQSVFISSNYRRGCALVAVNSDGAQIVWENQAFSSHFSSFVHLDGYIYGNDGDANAHRGYFRCLRVSDGVEMWSMKEGLGSVILAGGTLLFLSEKRVVIAVSPDPTKVEELGRFALPVKGLFWTPPVLSRGRLFVRSMSGALLCFDVG